MTFDQLYYRTGEVLLMVLLGKNYTSKRRRKRKKPQPLSNDQKSNILKVLGRG